MESYSNSSARVPESSRNREDRLQRRRERERARRASETAEQREERLRVRRARDRARRAAQTAEERDARLRQIRDNRRQRLAGCDQSNSCWEVRSGWRSELRWQINIHSSTAAPAAPHQPHRTSRSARACASIAFELTLAPTMLCIHLV